MFYGNLFPWFRRAVDRDIINGYIILTCASTRALSINVLESAIRPLMAHPENMIYLHTYITKCCYLR